MQNFKHGVRKLKHGEWDKMEREFYEKAELSEQNHLELINYCNDNKIQFYQVYLVSMMLSYY